MFDFFSLHTCPHVCVLYSSGSDFSCVYTRSLLNHSLKRLSSSIECLFQWKGLSTGKNRLSSIRASSNEKCMSSYPSRLPVLGLHLRDKSASEQSRCQTTYIGKHLLQVCSPTSPSERMAGISRFMAVPEDRGSSSLKKSAPGLQIWLSN